MERRAIGIRGLVQGVGFRPFVHGLASALELGGFVRNQASGVVIEVEGEAAALDRFLIALAENPPPLARIEEVSWQPCPLNGERDFRIIASAHGDSGPVFISPDVATCDACLAELFDSHDRRFGYPFLNCTICGPRLTIVKSAPYDRERTTMSAFPLCAACRAEYEDPTNRRFHAQPTACAVCGPRLFLHETSNAAETLARFAAALRAGQIGALKGLGGYHLACDATNQDAVALLRRRKERDEKPFALMVTDVESARRLCTVSAAEAGLLASSARPIVLLRKLPGARVAEAVAPGNPQLGIMLPYTPLHHLLMRELEGLPIVLTSGNRADEPIAYLDADAQARLADIADLFLTHNRPIHVRSDDSVTRFVDGVEAPIRRSRGRAPQPVLLPQGCPRPLLAVGGQFKGTFALGQGRQAFLSHHLGDLDHYDAFRAFERDVLLYQQLFAVEPEWLIHDLHPDYASTRYARERTSKCLPVQHHHAHLASCLAEHGLPGPALGVIFDGTGYGTDGTIWGGEFLVGAYRDVRRAAHLRPVGLPGGDRASRTPWRMALSYLLDAEADTGILDGRVPAESLRVVRQMCARGFQCPLTSSVGRLFDAAACLIGLRAQCSYEAQAACELEWLATSSDDAGVWPFSIVPGNEAVPHVIDTRPLIRALVDDMLAGMEGARLARRFHNTLTELIVDMCRLLREETGLAEVALSGGVFMNALLTTASVARLREAGFRVYRHRLVPANDGGLCLGQLAIAAARLS
ncbi:MAG: carbamoyltransferase HypF [Gemmataceae bacterium]